MPRQPIVSRVAALAAVVLSFHTPSAALAAAMEGHYWLEPLQGVSLDAAGPMVAADGGTLVWRYPSALLVRLPAGAAGSISWARLTPLPDMRLVGHWRLGEIDPVAHSVFASLEPALPSLQLVQLVGPPEEAWLAAIAAAGGEIVTFFPHAAELVRLDAAEAAAVRALPFVRAVVPWSAELKFDPETELWRSQALEAIVVNVVVFNPTSDLDATIDTKLAILRAGGIVSDGLAGNHQVLRAIVPSHALPTLAALPDVIAVEAYHQPVHDDESSDLIDAGQYSGEVGNSPPNPTYASYLTTIGLTGSRVTVGVVDDGVDTAETHLSGRVTNILSGASAGATGHGHHVAGIVAGSCSHAVDSQGYRLGAGVAPGASILNQPFLKAGWSRTGCGTATDYGCLTKQAATTNGSNGSAGYVQNNSWGAGTANPMTYTSIEREYDLRVRDADETSASLQALVVSFSAGNSGTAGLTRPKSAKNIITTGASDNYRPGFNSGLQPGSGNGCPAAGGNPLPSDNINMMVCFSSQGNCQDGRVKPDVVSPGGNIASARAGTDTLWGNIDTNHRWCSGTSQAAPATTGMAALIVDQWRRDHGGASPSPALVKAMLIASAVEMRTSTTPTKASVYNITVNLPNQYEGWGRVNTNRFLNPGTVSSEFRDQDAADLFGTAPTTRTFSYTIDASGAPSYVTLAWTDAAGAVNANPALVNDLDLEVDWNGNTYRGNVLSGKQSVTGGTRDSRNNVENVFLPSVSAGQPLTIRVIATTLNGDGVPGNADTTDQDFALVVYNAAPGQSLPPPVPDGLFVPGTAMKATKGSGDLVTVTWDVTTCTAANYNIYWAPIGSYSGSYAGGACAIGTSGSWTGTIPQGMWWGVAGTSGTLVSSITKQSTGSETPATGWQTVCPAQPTKNTSGTCP